MLFSDVPTQTDLLEHDIDVGDAEPIRQCFYRVPIEKKESQDKEVQYLLDNNLAEPSFSSWSSEYLLVKKSDGTHRFCTDYRKLNAVTKPDSFPLPCIEDCVEFAPACVCGWALFAWGYLQRPQPTHISTFSPKSEPTADEVEPLSSAIQFGYSSHKGL